MRLIVAVAVLFTFGPSAGMSRFLEQSGLPISAPVSSNDDTESEEEETQEDTSSKIEAESPHLNRASGRQHANTSSNLLPLPLTITRSPLSRIGQPSHSQPADALRNGLGTHYRC
jgi:hypothetical protein